MEFTISLLFTGPAMIRQGLSSSYSHWRLHQRRIHFTTTLSVCRQRTAAPAYPTMYVAQTKSLGVAKDWNWAAGRKPLCSCATMRPCSLR